MRELKFLILLVVLLAFNSVGARADQITHTVTYDPSKLSITYDTIDNVAYSKIYYKDMISVKSQGQPVLPSDVLLFSVPYNADSFDVQCNVVSYEEYQLNADVYAGSQIIEMNDSSVVVYNQKASEVYSVNAYYPDSLVMGFNVGFIHGNNRVLKTHLYPLSYNPVTRKIRLATSIQLVVNYTINSSIIPNIVRRNKDVFEKEQMITESFVQNGEDVANNSFTTSTQLNVPSDVTRETFPTYNYCIITSRELAPAFKKILAMKRQKGLSAGTVCVEDLIASPLFNTGDINYNNSTNMTYILNDSAGIVRNYLKYAFNEANNPTSFVLMGGKKEHAPVRYLGLTNYLETDTYFSDLTQVWDDDGNIWYGEGNLINLPIVFYPDLYVGRLLCDNTEEIDNYSNKLYQYNFNPGDGDASYLKRALYFFSHQYEEDFICTSSSDVFFDSMTAMDPFEGLIKGSDIINEINRTDYGFISGSCGGEPQAMWVYDYGYDDGNYAPMYLLTALDEIVPTSELVVDEEGNGLDNLKNNKCPAIFYSISRAAISDNSYQGDCLTQYSNKYNLGESFTVGGKYGGVAFLGFTKSGSNDWCYPLENAFFESMNTSHSYNLGVSESMSKVYYTPNYPEYTYNGRYNSIIAGHHLIGDPEVEMWTSEPQRYEGITVNRYGSLYMINGVTASDTIAYCDNDGNVGRVFGMNGFSFLNGMTPSISIMVYNHEHIPYIAPLLLQDCDINNSQYVYASSFSAGRNVISSSISGNVSIKNGAVYEIEATEDVHLGEGFIVENGATFAIKTPGKVTIDGCVFQCGAKVKIEAGKVEVVKSFTAERGSKVEIVKLVDY